MPTNTLAYVSGGELFVGPVPMTRADAEWLLEQHQLEYRLAYEHRDLRRADAAITRHQSVVLAIRNQDAFRRASGSAA